MIENELSEALNALTAKVDELQEAFEAKKENNEESMKEKLKAIVKKKEHIENKIIESPLPCTLGAFIGGLIIGFLASRRKDR